MPNRPSLVILYEYPDWLKPLFAVLDRSEIDYQAIRFDDQSFDLAQTRAPASVILSRLGTSSLSRHADHPIFYAQSLYAHWELNGARVINGTHALAVGTSKAHQLAVIQSLGLDIPATHVVRRPDDIAAATEGLRFPIVVKANIGLSGASATRYNSLDEVKQAVANGTVPHSIDSVTLVQEHVPARDRHRLRMETLNGEFLYAISLEIRGSTFHLCSGDEFLFDRPAVTVREFQPDKEAIRAAEAIARTTKLDIGGIEYVVDDRDGTRRFCNISALSNFVADPLNVLGWDPHETLVDYLSYVIDTARDKVD